MRYAVINSGGLVVNVVERDEESEWVPPEGFVAAPCGDKVSAGFTYNGASFDPPISTEPLPVAVDLSDIDGHQKALKALALVLAEKTGMTVQQLKAAFRAKWDALP